jgi:hypothetical protein
MKLRLLVLLLIPFLGACSVQWGFSDIGNALVNDPVERLRDSNRRKLAQVVAEMPRGEVDKLMGNDKAGGGVVDVLHGRMQHLQARNPMREELVTGVDGLVYEVVYYYTDLRQRDNRITDDELTPVVYRDGRVAGVGHGFLNERAAKIAQGR